MGRYGARRTSGCARAARPAKPLAILPNLWSSCQASPPGVPPDPASLDSPTSLVDRLDVHHARSPAPAPGCRSWGIPTRASGAPLCGYPRHRRSSSTAGASRAARVVDRRLRGARRPRGPTSGPVHAETPLPTASDRAQAPTGDSPLGESRSRVGIHDTGVTPAPGNTSPMLRRDSGGLGVSKHPKWR